MKISSSMPANASAPVALNKRAFSDRDLEDVKRMQEMQEEIDAISLQIIRNIAGVPDPRDAEALDRYAHERRTERDAPESERRAAEQSVEAVEPAPRIINKHAQV